MRWRAITKANWSKPKLRLPQTRNNVTEEESYAVDSLSKNFFLQPLSSTVTVYASAAVWEGLSSPKPPLLLRPCVVWSPTELRMKRLKLWKRAQIWFSPLHGFARGQQDRSSGFLDLFWAETAEVESSSSGYRSAWRETRRVKIGRWIALAPARSTTPARSTKASMGRAPQRRCVVAVGVVSTGRKRSGWPAVEGGEKVSGESGGCDLGTIKATI